MGRAATQSELNKLDWNALQAKDAENHDRYGPGSVFQEEMRGVAMRWHLRFWMWHAMWQLERGEDDAAIAYLKHAVDVPGAFAAPKVEAQQ